MNKKNIDYYLGLPYSIRFSKEKESGYFVKVDELKGCMSQGESLEDAALNIQDAMRVWLETAIDEGMDIPEPETFSGKFVLRLPLSLHRKLVENAKKENVSLNQYIIYLLSEQNAICSMNAELKKTYKEILFDFDINQEWTGSISNKQYSGGQKQWQIQ